MSSKQDEIMEDVKAVRKETTLEKHVQTILLSIITFAIITGFNKISSISESLVRLEEREKNRAEVASAMQQSIEKLKTDLSDLKERVHQIKK